LKMHTAAAINGVVLAGDLSWPWRAGGGSPWITSQYQIGLPEIKLGVLPGAGDTEAPGDCRHSERPMLACAGKSLKPDEALKLGLIDAVLPAEGFAGGVKNFLREE